MKLTALFENTLHIRQLALELQQAFIDGEMGEHLDITLKPGPVEAIGWNGSKRTFDMMLDVISDNKVIDFSVGITDHNRPKSNEDSDTTFMIIKDKEFNFVRDKLREFPGGGSGDVTSPKQAHDSILNEHSAFLMHLWTSIDKALGNQGGGEKRGYKRKYSMSSSKFDSRSIMIGLAYDSTSLGSERHKVSSYELDKHDPVVLEIVLNSDTSLTVNDITQTKKTFISRPHNFDIKGERKLLGRFNSIQELINSNVLQKNAVPNW